jgi:hypothetical protein
VAAENNATYPINPLSLAHAYPETLV